MRAILLFVLIVSGCDTASNSAPTSLPDGPLLVVAARDSLFAYAPETDEQASFRLGDVYLITDFAPTNRLAEEGKLVYQVEDITLPTGLPDNRFLEVPASAPESGVFIGAQPFNEGRATNGGALYAARRDDACEPWAVTDARTDEVVACVPLVPDASVIQQLYVLDGGRLGILMFTAIGEPILTTQDMVVFPLDGSGTAPRRTDDLDVFLADVQYHAPTETVYLNADGENNAVLALAPGETVWQTVFENPSGQRPGRRMLIDGDRMITYDRTGEGAGVPTTVFFLDVSKGPDAVSVVEELRLPFPALHQELHGRYLVFRSYILDEPETQFAGFCLDDPAREVRTRTVMLPPFALRTSAFSHSFTCDEPL